MELQELGPALPVRRRKFVAALQLAADDLLGMYFGLPVVTMIWYIGPGMHAPRAVNRILFTFLAIVVVMGFFQWIVYYYRVHLTVQFYENGIAFKKRFRRRAISWNEITYCRVKNNRWAEVRWPSGRLLIYWKGFKKPEDVLEILKNRVPNFELASNAV